MYTIAFQLALNAFFGQNLYLVDHLSQVNVSVACSAVKNKTAYKKDFSEFMGQYAGNCLLQVLRKTKVYYQQSRCLKGALNKKNNVHI